MRTAFGINPLRWFGDDDMERQLCRGGALTPEQIERNREISQERVRVEHGIRRVKGFRILRDQYRMARGIFPTVASAVVGLIHFRRCLA